MKRRWVRGLGVVVAAGAGVLASGRAAHAQSAAALAARSELIDQALNAQAAGDHARALDLARRAAAIQTRPSLRVVHAEEAQAVGALAEAYNEAEVCIHEAQTDPTLRNRAQILSRCHEVFVAVAPRVGRVVVVVPTPAPPGLAVQLGGHALDAALYGVPYVVDPGQVAIEATAADRAATRVTVAVAPGAPVRVVLWDGTAEPSPVAAGPSGTSPSRTAPSSAAGSNETSVAPRAARATPATRGGGPGVGPWITLGAGAVGLGAGFALWLVRDAAVATLDRDYCPWGDHRECIDSGEARAQDATARMLSVAAPIAVAVGGTAVAAAAVWWLAGRRAPEARATTSAAVLPVPGGLVLHVGGVL